MKVGLVQMTGSDDPGDNLDAARGLIADAVAEGAEFVLTPEVTNCISFSRRHQNMVLRHEPEDPTLAGLQLEARTHRIWLLVGSLALKSDDPQGRFANRSFLIEPSGNIVARYDKIHMFDVDVSETETYRESSGFRPGDRAVLAPTPFGMVGLSICYDIRFPALYRTLAQAGARILTIPAAFSSVTGAAHWHILARARAIETGCFVLAPAQSGHHTAQVGKPRRTFGHSLVVAPWGEVLADGGDDGPCAVVTEIDLGAVDQARARIPSLSHDRPFEMSAQD